MKTHTEYFTFETKKKRDYINITPQVEAAVKKSGVQEGLCLVNPMHITASVYVNDDEPGLIQDFDDFLERMAPYDLKGYRHHRIGEDNGDSHVKRQLFGREVVVAITKGRLDLGTWERIFYAEFDGRRPKRVIVKILGE
jgi:secondary thiamine-phosphate synthase enzyme